MRAAMVEKYGAPPVLVETELPPVGSGQAAVDVLAGGLNPVDIAIATGTFGRSRPALPYVAGRDGVGRLPDGARVYVEGAVAPSGFFAERAVVAVDEAIPVPDGLDDAVAVSLGIAGVAAWLALEWRAGLQAGETVLVLGASGVVGQVAVQAARLQGAGRVVAAARSAGALERARALGADEIVQIGDGVDLASAFRDACGGGGPDVVVDPLWGPPALAALDAAAPFARHVNLGQSAGAEAAVTSAAVRSKPLSIVGHTIFSASPELKRAAYTRLAAHAAAGEIAVEVERVPLDAIAGAWERQKSSPNRKLVIVP